MDNNYQYLPLRSIVWQMGRGLIEGDWNESHPDMPYYLRVNEFRQKVNNDPEMVFHWNNLFQDRKEEQSELRNMIYVFIEYMYMIKRLKPYTTRPIRIKVHLVAEQLIGEAVKRLPEFKYFIFENPFK